jgi:uncharacterized protein with ACT and thioredoxin-like domain
MWCMLVGVAVGVVGGGVNVRVIAKGTCVPVQHHELRGHELHGSTIYD